MLSKLYLLLLNTIVKRLVGDTTFWEALPNTRVVGDSLGEKSYLASIHILGLYPYSWLRLCGGPALADGNTETEHSKQRAGGMPAQGQGASPAAAAARRMKRRPKAPETVPVLSRQVRGETLPAHPPLEGWRS